MTDTTNQPQEEKQTPGQVRPFATVLRDLGRGAVIDEAAIHLQTLVKEVSDTGKKGRMTLVVEVAPMKGDVRALMVSARSDLKLPAGEPLAAVFFYDDDGNLTRDDPRQIALPLQEVPRENKELRQA